MIPSHAPSHRSGSNWAPSEESGQAQPGVDPGARSRRRAQALRSSRRSPRSEHPEPSHCANEPSPRLPRLGAGFRALGLLRARWSWPITRAPKYPHMSLSACFSPGRDKWPHGARQSPVRHPPKWRGRGRWRGSKHPTPLGFAPEDRDRNCIAESSVVLQTDPCARRLAAAGLAAKLPRELADLREASCA